MTYRSPIESLLEQDTAEIRTNDLDQKIRLSIAISLKRLADMAEQSSSALRPGPPDDFSLAGLEELLMTDVFDRIAAAIEAKSSGDNAAYDQHLSAIDAHLSQLDTADTDETTRLAAIEAGLSKVADAVNPPAATPTPSSSDTGTGTGTGADAGGASTGTADAGSAGTADAGTQQQPTS